MKTQSPRVKVVRQIIDQQPVVDFVPPIMTLALSNVWRVSIGEAQTLFLFDFV